MSRARNAAELVGPVVLVAVVGLLGTLVTDARALEFIEALVFVSIVVALYVFVGNSGVLSFGQISFFIVGAYAAGELSLPADTKGDVLRNVFPLLRDHTIGSAPSLVVAAAAGGIFALLVGMPLMRLSGLAAGIATFAVLEITHNILRNWEKIGPGPTTLTSVPETTDLWQATVAAIAVVCLAFAYQRSPLGRKLRAAREDPFAAQAAGIDVHRQRLWAFALSGALSGFAGGLWVHFQGTFNTDPYLELTFLTLAMLVVGGVGSLWGAVIGALVVSGLDSFLNDAENGDVGWLHAPDGTRLVVVAAFMAVVLVFLPRGLTGVRELRLPRLRRLRRPRAAAQSR
ncbi:MAG TPA: branched-chain amino acid ABC transporter permease [Gaiellaceae bacterium]|jgi:branched-chain amino acid transport system permease protein